MCVETVDVRSTRGEAVPFGLGRFEERAHWPAVSVGHPAPVLMHEADLRPRQGLGRLVAEPHAGRHAPLFPGGSHQVGGPVPHAGQHPGPGRRRIDEQGDRRDCGT